MKIEDCNIPGVKLIYNNVYSDNRGEFIESYKKSSYSDLGLNYDFLQDNLVYSRCSYSINKNLKMDDWIAIDENDYLVKLEKILSNKEKLLMIKKNLRENAIKNDLFNSKKFTKNLAEILNQTWKDFTVK